MNFFEKSYFLLVFIVISVGFECFEHENIIKRQSGQSLTESELKFALQGSFHGSKQDSITKVNMYIEDWSRVAALYQAALKEKVDKRDDVKFIVQRAKKKIVIDRFLKIFYERSEKKGLLNVDSVDVAKYYKAKEDEFIVTQKVFRVRKFFTKSSNQFRFIRSKAKTKGKLEELLISTVKDSRIKQKNIEEDMYSKNYLPLSKIKFGNNNQQKQLNTLQLDQFTSPARLSDSLYVSFFLIDYKNVGDKLPLREVKTLIKERLILSKKKRMYNEIIRNNLNQ